MFEQLSDKIGGAFRNLSGRGRITEDNVKDALDQVRRALLEADVQVDVAREFCDQVMNDAIGHEVTRSLKPSQEMLSIINQRLIDLMGPADSPLEFSEHRPTVIMMCGLQGSGKTTTCGKLAALLRKQGRSVLVTACDLQRPAAVEQLQQVVQTVKDQTGGPALDVQAEPERCAEYGKAVGVAVGVAQRALKRAKKENYDVLIIDTAGRLHIDDSLMTELDGIRNTVMPHQILLVVDAMTGQDAVNSAKAFNQRLAIDGVILTKFDSDTRGGAALTVKQVTGAPIKFIGVGEKIDQLESFHPERMASRILGMGDVISLVEKAKEQVSEEDAEKMAQKMAKGKLTMDDFVKQLRSLRRMGSIKSLLGMLPGMGSLGKLDVNDKQFDQIEAMASSMTAKERQDMKLVDRSRTRRIAEGSGTSSADVSRLKKQFEMMQKMSKQMAGMGSKEAAMQMGSMDPESMARGMAGMGGRGSTKTTSVKKQFKRRKRR